jgi:hypothetical protein
MLLNQNKLVFDFGKPFQPGLKFAGKAKSLPRGENLKEVALI